MILPEFVAYDLSKSQIATEGQSTSSNDRLISQFVANIPFREFVLRQTFTEFSNF